ncbi:MAG: excinuclease ABC subunit UvrA [Bacteroidales bacterium]
MKAEIIRIEQALKDEGSQELESQDSLCILGARVHNLKNLDLQIPRNTLSVITGLSGSGKTSLAFDTIYAEGQRRFMETFSAYARQFIGNMARPDVDKITGLSPVISIEQKTTSKNPRSTVGTVTEIYDFLRLLYARISDAYSYKTGKKMVQYTPEQIISLVHEHFSGKKAIILAPVIKGRKGHYRELFETIRRQGFTKVRVDGEVRDITYGMKVDRYKVHDIEIVIDRIGVDEKGRHRTAKAIDLAMKQGRGLVMVMDYDSGKIRQYSRSLMCVDSGISYDPPEPNTFSFNSPYGACPECNGLGSVSQIDMKKIIPDESLSIKQGAIAPLGKYRDNWIFRQIETLGRQYKFKLSTPVRDINAEALHVLLYGANHPLSVQNDYLGVISSYELEFEGIVNFILSQNTDNAPHRVRKWVTGFMNTAKCPACKGYRLKKESLHFKVHNKHIGELAEMDLSELQDWIGRLPEVLGERKQTIAYEIVREIQARINFLLDVGIDYLSLNRPAKSLSGGEAQRIRLGTQIGSQLVGVLYILDEPSIGLHQRDNFRLINSLKKLRDLGNSVIVVEHDEEMIRSADFVADIGPGAGRLGGEVAATGSPEDIENSSTVTGQYLSRKKKIRIPGRRRPGSGKMLRLKGAEGNNLKKLALNLPLAKLVCVTGVSGSGKSSLINETLYPILNRYFFRAEKNPLPYRSVEGLTYIDKVIEIDQSPIGRTPRSNPSTYTGVFSHIRNIFVQLPESKIRGYKAGRFSFNVKGGRCEECKGAGLKMIEMNFLPDVQVECVACNGRRYNRETLEIRYKGKSISDVLNMTINQAVIFFDAIPQIKRKLKTLQDVGLGYITLGQQSTTLSGGEAQRVKLAAELSKKDTGKTLYILDEPTTGLHFEDIRVLLNVVNKLVDKGNTVIIIEHNMDIIKMADHIIDMGPEGGKKGGEIIAEGTPEQVAERKNSYTASALRKVLRQ